MKEIYLEITYGVLDFWRWITLWTERCWFSDVQHESVGVSDSQQGRAGCRTFLYFFFRFYLFRVRKLYVKINASMRKTTCKRIGLLIDRKIEAQITLYNDRVEAGRGFAQHRQKNNLQFSQLLLRIFSFVRFFFFRPCQVQRFAVLGPILVHSSNGI